LVLVLPFWYGLTRVVPDKIQRARKRLYVWGATYMHMYALFDLLFIVR